MPLYDYLCNTCGEKTDIWAGMSETMVACPDCGHLMTRLIGPSNIICDIEPYLDGHMAQNPVPIHSRQHKAEELKKRGLYIK